MERTNCLQLQERNKRKRVKLRLLKYIILFFLFGASLLGVSFVFVAAPLSLITRFYGLLVHPVLAFLSNEILGLVQPLTEWLDMDTLIFMQIATPRFCYPAFLS